MPFCSTCGLSMSETAQFCPTCGTRAVGESVSATMARPLWAGAEAAPSSDGFALSPIAPPAAKRSAPHGNTTRLAITAAAAILVIVLVAVFAHNIVTGAQGERYTQDKASKVAVGLSLAQVEAIMGAPPTSQVNYTNGAVGYFWKNSDGSMVWVDFRNDASDLRGLYLASHQSASPRLAIGAAGLSALMAAFAAVVFGACLFVATKLFGYSITVTQVVVFAIVTGLISVVPYAGGLLALLVGAALIERWSSAGWWTSVLIILAAGFITGVLAAAFVGAGFGLGLAL